MKFIEQSFLQCELIYQGSGYLPFIEWSIFELNKENYEKNICSTELYWLLCYIKDNVRSSLAQFWNYNIENDILGFPVIQRELRHSIEAYLDLYNLVNDEKYKCVLSYCANSNKKKKNKIELGKYKEYLYKNEFTIRSKYKISGLENEKLMDMSSKANSYTHPDVYLNLTEICNNKDALLRDLIEMNFYLLSEAFDLFVKGIKNYGASTYLLNNYITAYGVQYYYRDLYKNKKNNAFEFIKNSLIVNQQVLNQQNYIISG